MNWMPAYFASDIALCFQPGLTPRNSRQGFYEKNQLVGYFDYDFDYLTLPLLVRVTGDPVGVRGFVTAGLEFSVLLDATVDVGEGAIDFKDQLDNDTLGALLGAGAMVPLGRNFLLFELRYVQGLDDIVARDTLDPEEEEALSPSVKYRGLQLQIGYLFTLGGD